MTVCVSYMRCSGESQISGDTWERQSAAILKYALAQGIVIEREFRDEGVTGKMELEGRSGLSACLQYVRENEVKLVIVEDSTRLARDMIVAEVVIREFQKIGVKVISASGGVDLTEGDDSNPTAKLIRQILAAVSEFERCCITLKLRGARDRKKKEFGKCEGRKSYGERPEEEIVVSRMRVLRVTGYTCYQIAEILNKDSVPTRMGGKWREGVIAKILARPISNT